MTSSTAERMTSFVVAFGLAMVALGYALWGSAAALSAAIGAVLGLCDLLALRFIGRRLVSGSVPSKGAFAFVLFAKFVALLGVIYFLMARHVVVPLPFLLGMSALAGGVLTASFFTATTAPRAAGLNSEH